MRRTCTRASCWLLVGVLTSYLSCTAPGLESDLLKQMKTATQSHTRSDWSVLFISKLKSLNRSHNSNPMRWPKSTFKSRTDLTVEIRGAQRNTKWAKLGSLLLLGHSELCSHQPACTCERTWQRLSKPTEWNGQLSLRTYPAYPTLHNMTR